MPQVFSVSLKAGTLPQSRSPGVVNVKNIFRGSATLYISSDKACYEEAFTARYSNLTDHDTSTSPRESMRSPRKEICGVRWRSVGYSPLIRLSPYATNDLDLWRTGNWSQGADRGLQFCMTGLIITGFEFASTLGFQFGIRMLF